MSRDWKLSNGVPTYDEVLLPLLTAAAQGPLTRAEATDKVSEIMELRSDQRAALMPRGHTIIRDRVGWARTYLVQAELLCPVRRGVFEITDAGRELLKAKPTRITYDDLLKYDAFKAFSDRSRASRKVSGDGGEREEVALQSTDITPEARIDAALAEIDAILRATLLDRIRAATPEFFEHLVVTLLSKMGYGGARPGAARHIGGPADGGVDGVIQLDPLGLDVVYIQAKKYHAGNRIGRPTLQGFSGALDAHGATRGVFITTSDFSAEAIGYAKDIKNKQIALIDAEKLAELLIAHDIAVREELSVVVKKLDEDFFEE